MAKVTDDTVWAGEYGHRDYVTPGNTYDTGTVVFEMLRNMGLKWTDSFCDVGCGSLRYGRFLISYLEPEKYYAIEPNKWLVDRAIIKEIGTMAQVKRAKFDFGRTDFNVTDAFNRKFDWILISAIFIHSTHSQLKEGLFQAFRALEPGGRVVFDTYPQGPDHTGEDWLYPQIAPHYDFCVQAAVPEGARITKLGMDYRNAQWWHMGQWI